MKLSEQTKLNLFVAFLRFANFGGNLEALNNGQCAKLPSNNASLELLNMNLYIRHLYNMESTLASPRNHLRTQVLNEWIDPA